MEYKVKKSSKHSSPYTTQAGLADYLHTCCLLNASHILRTMPDFKEDDEYVTFTQQGFLTWFADRMEVDKKVA